MNFIYSSTISTIGRVIVRRETHSPLTFGDAPSSRETRVYLSSISISIPLSGPRTSRNANRARGAAQYANATIVVPDNICLTER